MDTNHYDTGNILGCPGQQFSDAPSFALWTRLPLCCHNILFYVTRLFLVIISLPLLLPLLCLAIALLLPLSVVCLPCLCCIDDIQDYSFSKILNTVILLFLGFLLTIIWFPIALALSPFAWLWVTVTSSRMEWVIYFMGPGIYPFMYVMWQDDD